MIAPDGCRDLICAVEDGRPSWYVSELFDTVGESTLNGEAFGWRLRPGTEIQVSDLVRALGSRHPSSIDVIDTIHQHTLIRPHTTEALGALAIAPSVESAAAQIGVTTRTLQRRIRQSSSRHPHYWIALARARKCVRAIDTNTDFAELAFELNYADQAHMTRELRRWFDTTPGAIRTDPELASRINEHGYGD